MTSHLLPEGAKKQNSQNYFNETFYLEMIHSLKRFIRS